jgi:ribosome-associated translation inhibitor RaiA
LTRTTVYGGVLIFSNHAARIIEAYVGEYASGKSELSINRALELKARGHRVTIVDLDTVEPFYTLRPISKSLEEKGLKVISQTQEDSFGLGETGAMLNPRARWALMNEGDIIMDIGYGVNGARTLNLVEGAYESEELQIMAVVNYTRPMTNSLERIKEYLISLGRVDAIVANTHLAEQTTTELIVLGNNQIIRAAAELDIPVAYAAVDRRWQDPKLEQQIDVPVKYIDRYMPAAMW